MCLRIQNNDRIASCSMSASVTKSALMCLHKPDLYQDGPQFLSNSILRTVHPTVKNALRKTASCLNRGESVAYFISHGTFVVVHL